MTVRHNCVDYLAEQNCPGCDALKWPSIHFSADLMPALMSGTKTQTRRPVEELRWLLKGPRRRALLCWLAKRIRICRYGKPGDLLRIQAGLHLLLIKSLRVERLQSISDADAVAEGISMDGLPGTPKQAYYRFRSLWKKIYGAEHPEGKGWDQDPYVWVIGVEKVTPDDGETLRA